MSQLLKLTTLWPDDVSMSLETFLMMDLGNLLLTQESEQIKTNIDDIFEVCLAD